MNQTGAGPALRKRRGPCDVLPLLLVTAVVALSAPGIARAQAPADPKPADRPSEADIFGAPAPKPPPGQSDQGDKGKAESADKPAADTPERPAEPPAAAERPAPVTERPTPPAATPESDRDAALLGDPDGASRLSAEAAPDDPLRIGGMFYLQSLSSARQGSAAKNWSFTAPALLDGYLDGRPNERVRGLVLARMTFDPTLPEGAPTMAAMGPGGDMLGMGGVTGISDLTSLFGQRTRGPRVVLDQMWLRFDLARTIFVTAGKQHVRWGTARFWTPTDFLHIRRRNPLDNFDARTGTTMLKLHAPWERTGWNFYAYGLLEGTDATSRLGDLAGAARAEVVLGATEIGAGALVQSGHKPKIGIDVSTGIWDLDLYGEMAVRYGSEIDRVSYVPDQSAGTPFLDMYPVTRRSGVKTQVVGGVSYSRKYNDNDVFTFGGEYFYNPLGYASPTAYPGLLLPRTTPLQDPATFFYLGRQYGAVFLSLPAPYSWDYTTFNLSALGNFSDQSFITRFDYFLTLLTHLRFEAFVAVRYGRTEGEFRFGVDDLTIDGKVYRIRPALLDLGVALRVDL